MPGGLTGAADRDSRRPSHPVPRQREVRRRRTWSGSTDTPRELGSGVLVPGAGRVEPQTRQDRQTVRWNGHLSGVVAWCSLSSLGRGGPQ